MQKEESIIQIVTSSSSLAPQVTSFSSAMYDFMKVNGIGESLFGKAMDEAGRHVMNHRLYGHHIIADFPNEIKNIPDFLIHEFSDLFTKQGLPILPGRTVENTQIYNHCSQISNSNWNMINGFDILAGVTSIYLGSIILSSAISGEFAIQNFGDFAMTIGIGLFELAISLSTSNPLLLVGSLLSLIGGMIALFNYKNITYLDKYLNQFSISVSNKAFDIQNSSELWRSNVSKFSIETINLKWKLENQSWV